MKILIQGYYGFGNLGDDILMKVTFWIVKERFPQSEIKIFSNASQEGRNYIDKIIGEKVSIINYSYNDHFDLIIHGGGGIHYDYETNSFKFTLLNKLIRLFGYKYYVAFYKWYKRIKGKENITTSNRIGIGIGVGTFTLSSKKFYTSLSILADYNLLLVRDKLSLARARQYVKGDKLVLSTDLAFMKDYWHPKILPQNAANARKKVGVVLRNWKFDTKHIADLTVVTDKLRDQQIDFTFFMFQNKDDNAISSLLPKEAIVKYWNPNSESMDEYLGLIATQDIIITSRFHGAIIASSFGIPSIVLAIEPKLESLNEILPSATTMNLPVDGQLLFEKIIDNLGKLKQLKLLAMDDYEANSKKINKNLSDLKF